MPPDGDILPDGPDGSEGPDGVTTPGVVYGGLTGPLGVITPVKKEIAKHQKWTTKLLETYLSIYLAKKDSTCLLMVTYFLKDPTVRMVTCLLMVTYFLKDPTVQMGTYRQKDPTEYLHLVWYMVD
jgi:hypothetical protein